MKVEHMRQRSLLYLFWEGCVAQVLLARGQLFGVDTSWKQRGSLLLRHAQRNHHTVPRLGTDKKSRFRFAASCRLLTKM